MFKITANENDINDVFVVKKLWAHICSNWWALASKLLYTNFGKPLEIATSREEDGKRFVFNR